MTADQADDPPGSLELTGGRVLDPGRGLDTAATVSVADGLIEGVRPSADAEPGRRRIDVAGQLVTPGLVDLHTHLYPGVSHYGIEPDEHCLGRGVTTAVDAGSAGAQTFPGLRRYVIERSRTSILAFLNIAVEGMISTLVGELEDIRWASPGQGVARAREHPDLIVGVKVRLGWQMVGADPGPALRLAREAADALGLPLMVHVIDMRPGLAWLLAATAPRRHRDALLPRQRGRHPGPSRNSAAGGGQRPRARGAVRRGSRRRLLHLPGRARGPSPRGSRPTPSPATCMRTMPPGRSSTRRPRSPSCCMSA